MIAALSSWQASHERARVELRDRLGRGETMLLAAHSLVECYSVLTRLPAPLRLSPEVALRMIRDGVVSRGTVIGMRIDDYLGFLERSVVRGVAGGRIYDALIMATAKDSGADVLITLNRRHFDGLEGGVEVREPGSD